jgi:tetratricopeptide (TPR) repeat protein
MTSKMTRAALAALLVAASPFALSLTASAQLPGFTEPPKPGDHSHDGPAKPKGTGPTVSSKVGNLLGQAGKDIAAQKLPDALTDSKNALAAATTDYDKVASNQYITMVAFQMKDNDTAGTAAIGAADAALNVPDLPDDTKKSIFTNGIIFAVNMKQAAKAVPFAKQLQALNLTDARSQQIIAQALSAGGDSADAIAYVKQQVDGPIAAGQRPTREALDNLFAAQGNAKDEAGAEQTLEYIITYYNDAAAWQNLVNAVITAPGMRDLDYIYLGRLLFVLDAPVNKTNADAVGQTASHIGFFGDAQNAAAHGATGFPDPTPKIAQDKASMNQQIAAGAKSDGLYNIKLAEALYSYGMYPQAEAAAKLAQSKPGVKDASEVGIVLGQAQAAQGKYADAIATFGQVTGGGPDTPRIVRLWTIYAKNKANPPSATASAAAPAPAPAH